MIRYCVKRQATGLYLQSGGVWCEEPEWFDKREALRAMWALSAAQRVSTVIEEHEFSAADCGVEI